MRVKSFALEAANDAIEHLRRGEVQGSAALISRPLAKARGGGTPAELGVAAARGVTWAHEDARDGCPRAG